MGGEKEIAHFVSAQDKRDDKRSATKKKQIPHSVRADKFGVRRANVGAKAPTLKGRIPGPKTPTTFAMCAARRPKKLFATTARSACTLKR